MHASRYGRRYLFVVMVLLLLLVLAIAVGMLIRLLPKKETDPHAGQVYLYDGKDWVWMTPLEGVAVNELTEEQFEMRGGRPEYVGTEYIVQRGLDVSEHQMEINWAQAASAVDYAYIRLGWRGYTEGGLFEDARWKTNLRGATENGVPCGVYFFSQAITAAEAIEEANFVLARIGEYKIELPIVYDWEYMDEPDARTKELSAQTRTDCAVAFCETVRRAGYEPCVYFNRDLGYYGYDLQRLTDYAFWFSLPESPFPNFYYASDMWQYSFTESVPGVEEGTDMNLRFLKKQQPDDTAGE